MQKDKFMCAGGSFTTRFKHSQGTRDTEGGISTSYRVKEEGRRDRKWETGKEKREEGDE